MLTLGLYHACGPLYTMLALGLNRACSPYIIHDTSTPPGPIVYGAPRPLPAPPRLRATSSAQLLRSALPLPCRMPCISSVDWRWRHPCWLHPLCR